MKKLTKTDIINIDHGWNEDWIKMVGKDIDTVGNDIEPKRGKPEGHSQQSTKKQLDE